MHREDYESSGNSSISDDEDYDGTGGGGGGGRRRTANNNNRAVPPDPPVAGAVNGGVRAKIVAFMLMDPALRQADARKSNVSLEDVKQMARYLNIPSSQAKVNLVNAIVERATANRTLDMIRLEETEAEGGGEHIWNSSSFSRYCNLIFKYPDAVERMGALATRMELQFGEIAHNKRVFVDTCDEWNDRTLHSGGNVIEHEELRNVNPEDPGVGNITPKQGYKEFRKIKSYYTNVVLPKFEASGRHDGRDIAHF